MNKRVISAIIFTLIWIAILLINSDLFDTLVVVLLSLLAMYEYNKAFKGVGYKPISWLGYLSCLAIFGMGGIISEEYKIMLTKIILPLGLISAFSYIVVGKAKRTVIDIAVTIFSVIYIPFMFSFLKLILNMPNGRLLITYVLCGAFVSDTFAFLVGSRIGRTKLAPEISPNKTVEGSIGGIFGVLAAFVVLTLIANRHFGLNMSVAYWILVGSAASIAGQFGDLIASAIKRFCKIKDFGNLMPGHGGVLDRFDSLMFVAPIVYIFIKLYV